MNNDISNDIWKVCMKTYLSLGRKGKPQQGKEWTTMAAIVQTYQSGCINIVCMATGTKCIGATQRCPNGYILNDSHAEVLARRLFLRYLYHQLSIADDKVSIFKRVDDENLFSLKDGYDFHLVTTDTPCGDASIYPKKPDDNMDNNRDNLKTFDGKTVYDNKETICSSEKTSIDGVSLHTNGKSRKRKLAEMLSQSRLLNNHSSEKKLNELNVDCGTSYCVNLAVNDTHSTEAKRVDETIDNVHRTEDKRIDETVDDIHRTGAKCVPLGEQDNFLPGNSYHVIGALRIKPGRGERTLSMSCSDKIMKWCYLGIEGGLLSNFISNPIFLKSVIICTPFCDTYAVRRAFSLRGRQEYTSFVTPEIYHIDAQFIDGKTALEERYPNQNISACSMSILWCPACSIYEVANNGRKHGLTKKYFNTSKCRTSVSKSMLFENFRRISDRFNGKTYRECKKASKRHAQRRETFFTLFHDWIRKPEEYESFYELSNCILGNF